MLIKYEFVNETVEIEVTEKWATVIADLDRQDYNTEHRETRRHCSLEAYNVDDALLPSDEDVVGDVMKKQENDRLYQAIQRLTPEQQDLITAVYFRGVSVNDYAEKLGVDHSAISHRLNRAKNSLKKFLE